ncbi:MAG: glycosyltransferase family 87 protein [Terriglobia bacterium]|nr:glycosyltransferase family 87 protein [Terriglobia bacterium]
MLKRILAVSLVVGSIVLLGVGLRSESGAPYNRDFIAYWTAGQLLVHHQNPYSDSGVLALERESGYRLAVPLIMRNPPWALPLVVPLGYVSAYVGVLGWILAIVASIVVAVRLLKVVNGNPDSQDHLLAYWFAPVLACVTLAQTSPFACLGLVLFLYWRNDRPFAAGLAASIMLIKPHLFVLFFLVMLIETVATRSYRRIYGILTGFILAISVPLAYDHSVLSQYFIRSRVSQIGEEFIPSLPGLLRMMIARQAFWVQFVPIAIASVWAVWYYQRHRGHWEWNREGLMLVLVSVWAAPYSLLVDEVVLLPAVVAAIYFTGGDGRPNKATITVFFILNGIAFVLLFAQVSIMSGAYIWTSTAWVGWYLYATRPTARFAVARSSS